MPGRKTTTPGAMLAVAAAALLCALLGASPLGARVQDSSELADMVFQTELLLPNLTVTLIAVDDIVLPDDVGPVDDVGLRDDVRLPDDVVIPDDVIPDDVAPPDDMVPTNASVDVEAPAQAGEAVALAGTTLVVASMAAPAAVFTLQDGVWAHAQSLGQRGTTLAFDGTTILLGDPAVTRTVYVYEQVGGPEWVQTQTLSENTHYLFGVALAVDTQRGLALISARANDSSLLPVPSIDDIVPARPAAVYAYKFNNETGAWHQDDTLVSDENTDMTGSSSGGDLFGYSVSIDYDNGLVTAVIGAPHDDEEGTNCGAAYIFVYDTEGDQVWTQTQKLLATAGCTGSQDEFGFSTAIAGSTATIGAPFARASGTLGAGQASVAVRSTGADDGTGGTWVMHGTLSVSETTSTAYAHFGTSVALSTASSPDAVYLLVGAPQDSALSEENGAVYFFSFENNGNPSPADFTEIGKFMDVPTDSGVKNGQLGASVALDSSLLGAAGAPGYTAEDVVGAGAVFVLNFACDSTASCQCGSGLGYIATPDASAAMCETCAPGSKSVGADTETNDDLVCTLCSSGTYQDKWAQTTCRQCPNSANGTDPEQGATDWTDCVFPVVADDIIKDDDDNDSHGLSTGAVAGVVIGSVAAVGMIAAAVMWLRRPRSTAGSTPSQAGQSDLGSTAPYIYLPGREGGVEHKAGGNRV